MPTTSLFDDLSGDDDATDGKPAPGTKTVDWFHANVSSNQPTDIHHRVGFGPSDAAPGNHTHNGQDSPSLFDGSVVLPIVSGASTSTQLADAINKIAELLRTKGAG